MLNGEASRRFKGVRGPPSSITPEQEIKLRELVAMQPAITIRQLTKALDNVVSRQTVGTWCAYLGLPLRRKGGKPTKLTPDLEKRLRAFTAKHPSAGYKAIARALHQPVATVTDWIKRLGLPLHTTRGHASTLTLDLEKRLREFIAQHPSATYAATAKALRRPRCNIIFWIKRLGLPHSRKGIKNPLKQ